MRVLLNGISRMFSFQNPLSEFDPKARGIWTDR